VVLEAVGLRQAKENGRENVNWNGRGFEVSERDAPRGERAKHTSGEDER
jgi:hypothetical protein